MSDRSYDAVIVGGGPAGASAARELARAGLHVVLLERQPLPRYKTCGGGVLARALAWLPEDVELESERTIRNVELRVVGVDAAFSVRRSDPLVAMTMRDRFDQALVRSAIHAGAEVRTACSFLGLAVGDDDLRVRTNRGELRARFLVGADGALGTVARSAGWGPPAVGIPALEWEVPTGEEALARFAETARFDLGWPIDGYAWVFPKRRHLSVGVLCMHRRPAGLRETLDRYLERVGIAPVSAPRRSGFQIPLRTRPGGPSRGRVFLVGDAAGLADPVTAEGISHAIRSGQLAARSIARHAESPGAARQAYLQALREEILPDLRVARVLARIVYGFPSLRPAFFRRFGQTLCDAMTEIILGHQGYVDLLSNPANYARLLRRWAGFGNRHSPRRGRPELDRLDDRTD